MSIEKEVHQWIEIFMTDTEARLRAATELALIGIRFRRERKSVRGDLDEAASRTFSGISFVNFLETALFDEREQVQCEAVFAVGELAGEEVVNPLLKQLQNLSPGSKLYAAITRALSKIGGPEVKKHLFAQLQNENTMRGIVGLVTQHKAGHEAFSKEFHTPPDLAVRASGAAPSATSAIEIREWLENIRDQHKNEYVGLLAEQVL